MSNDITIHRPNIVRTSTTKSKSDGKEYIPENYKDFAQGLEKQLANVMVNEMTKSIARANGESTAMNYYNGLLNDKRSDGLTTNNGGLGLQDLILDQVYPKKFRNKQAYDQQMKHQNRFVKQKYEMAGPQQVAANGEATKEEIQMANPNKKPAIRIYGKGDGHE